MRDLVFEVIFNLRKLSDELEVVFELVDHCLRCLLESSNLYQLLDHRDYELLLTFWPLIGFPMILDLLNKASKLN